MGRARQHGAEGQRVVGAAKVAADRRGSDNGEDEQQDAQGGQSGERGAPAEGGPLGEEQAAGHAGDGRYREGGHDGTGGGGPAGGGKGVADNGQHSSADDAAKAAGEDSA